MIVDLNDLTRDRIVRASSGEYSCTVCGFSSPHRSSVKYHVEAKHIETPGYSCPFCQRFCPTLNSLKCHKRRCQTFSSWLRFLL